ncbi:putative phytol kinase 1 [Hibiscus syriacus]|uniref:Phytol kinase 1 n=2 Tax=Hibiscus syriacus TaxID=106335 RepID=A0A6A3B0M3_HIBSY|nr:putative phytol kinase 1 [Hibiscus syriacus]
MSLSLSFTHPIISRHVYSAAFSHPIPLHPPRSLFLSPYTPNKSRFHILYRVPHRATALSATAVTASIFRYTVASATFFAGAYALAFTFDTLNRKELIQQSLSRKLVHILSGLLFAISWPIFSNTIEARYFASLVPLVNCLRLVIHVLSLSDDQSMVKSVTREGDPK